ncbi:MAG: hypothetical protein KDC11_11005, partial [Chitinophagaceae bacterium]|nr:hypothetical protein [Chitinophagaceae bacterium]
MKKLTLRRLNSAWKLLTSTLLLLFIITPFTILAQPSWGPPGAAGQTDQGRSITYVNTGSDVETINCDMYTDMSTGSSGDYVYAIVWDEWDGTNWRVFIEVIESYAAGTTPLAYHQVALDGKHPDVVFGEDANAPGQVRVGIVYEQFDGGIWKVQYAEYGLQGLFGNAGIVSFTNGTSPYFSVSPTTINANASNDASYPHIDAYPRYYNGSWYGGANTYEPLKNYAITWQEDDGSGTPEVWLTSNMFGQAPTSGNGSTAEKVLADATNPDVAAACVDNNDTSAYVSYINASGEITVKEYNLGPWNGIALIDSTTVESTDQVIGTPRIDATNVIDKGTSDSRWAVTYAYDNTSTSQQEVKMYDMVAMQIDFGNSNDPYNSGADGYNPALAIGPGQHTYVTSKASEFGNINYLQATNINVNSNIYATDYDYSNNTFGNYQTVCSLSLHINVGNPPFAVSTASNSGIGHLAAWLNYRGAPTSSYSIEHKVNSGSTMSFKPGKANSVVKIVDNSDYSAYPNPTTNHVTVNGINGNATYTATDITGKVVMQGSVTPFSNS